MFSRRCDIFFGIGGTFRIMNLNRAIFSFAADTSKRMPLFHAVEVDFPGSMRHPGKGYK